MNQEKSVAKVLRDLKQFGLIKEDDMGQVRPHLNRLYVAGWEERGMIVSKGSWKPVTQYNSKKEVIKDYPSIIKAAKENKTDELTIQRAIKSEKMTRKRHYWKYKKGVEPITTPPFI